MSGKTGKKFKYSKRHYHLDLPLKRLKRIILIVIVMLLIGTFGYRLIEHYTIFDSVYMTVITLTTVGFGELKPFTPAGRLFTIFLILGGVIVITYAIETMIEIVTDPNVSKYIKEIALDKRLRHMDNHYIICGIGRVGIHVADELAAVGAPFICIEKDPKVAEAGKKLDYLIIEDDATDDEVLLRAGIDRAKGLICTMDSDVNNLFVTISARNIRKDIIIITRVSDDRSIEKFKQAGATQVVSPYAMLGKRIARNVLKPTVASVIDLALNEPDVDFHVEEVHIDGRTPFYRKSVQKSGIKQNTGASIISIVKEDKSLINNPSPDVMIEKGDTLILIGSNEQLGKVREMLEMSEQEKT